jgi:hypothetical protein
MTSDTDGTPPRRRRGGRRKSGPRPGQKPFDPLSQTWVEQGKSWLAKKARTERERNLAEAEFLARHFQLDERGALPEEEKSQNKGVGERQERVRRLTAYPPIPPGELQRLEGIIKSYGLPLSALSSDTAAFVVRRVMVDFHRLAVLRRTLAKPMFTADELIELMRVLKVKPAQLAEMVAPGTGTTRNNAMGSIHRWMHGASRPTSVLAIRLNRMIEQNVRRAPSGGAPLKREEAQLSQKPETVRRRAQKQRKRQEDRIEAPLAYAVRKEEADATETPDGD